MSDDPLSEEFARWSSEDVVSSVVAELIEGAHAAASEKELASKARVRGARRHDGDAAGGALLLPRGGRRRVVGGGAADVGADDEPAPASIDSWSRGAVASRKKRRRSCCPRPATRAAWRAAAERPANSPRSPRRPTEPAKEAPRLSSRPGAEQFKAPEKGSGGFGAPSRPKEEKPVMTPAEIRAAKRSRSGARSRAARGAQGGVQGARLHLRQRGERHRPPAGTRARAASPPPSHPPSPRRRRSPPPPPPRSTPTASAR